jgi:hypothetical protein
MEAHGRVPMPAIHAPLACTVPFACLSLVSLSLDCDRCLRFKTTQLRKSLFPDGGRFFAATLHFGTHLISRRSLRLCEPFDSNHRLRCHYSLCHSLTLSHKTHIIVITRHIYQFVTPSLLLSLCLSQNALADHHDGRLPPAARAAAARGRRAHTIRPRTPRIAHTIVPISRVSRWMATQCSGRSLSSRRTARRRRRFARREPHPPLLVPCGCSCADERLVGILLPRRAVISAGRAPTFADQAGGCASLHPRPSSHADALLSCCVHHAHARCQVRPRRHPHRVRIGSARPHRARVPNSAP